eukprot:6248522-Ditylum_brightwellii.AAC.1
MECTHAYTNIYLQRIPKHSTPPSPNRNHKTETEAVKPQIKRSALQSVANMSFSLSTLIDIALDENATAVELLCLVLCFSVFWSVTFSITGAIVRPLVYDKPWLRAAGER